MDGNGNWITIIDVAICALIMFFLIGQRFNQWPAVGPSLLSGKPSDYIDPFRYHAYYLIYICTFVVVGVAIYNLELAVPEDLQVQQTVNQITQKLGRHSWTIAALYLLALVNEKHVEKWDALWRNRLQMWARIPRAVDEMKDSLLFNEDAFTPNQDRLEDRCSEMRKLGVEGHWEPVIDNWPREREKSSFDWHFLKALYTLRICKQLRVAALNPDDIYRHEKRLHDLARVLPKIDWHNEDAKDYVEGVNKLHAYFVESLCKHVIRKNPSKNVQREALQNLGFHPRVYDIPEIRIAGVTFNCLLCISIVCFVTIFGYLSILDWAGLNFRPGENWFMWDRLLKWTVGSIISYSMAIFIAIIIEKAASAEESQPGIITYVTALLFSTLCSLTFFRVINPNVRINWNAHLALALSMGIIAIAVIRSLTEPTCRSKQEVWVSSLYHAVLIGLPALLEDHPFNITTRNISRGGLLIEPGRSLNAGQCIVLNFAFGAIQTKVQWVSKRFAGLSISEESPNIKELFGFIRNRFGVSYA